MRNHCCTGSIARELTTEQIWSGYKHRSPVETNFFVALYCAGMEMPRAWTLECYPRVVLVSAMLAGFVLKARREADRARDRCVL